MWRALGIRNGLGARIDVSASASLALPSLLPVAVWGNEFLLHAMGANQVRVVAAGEHDVIVRLQQEGHWYPTPGTVAGGQCPIRPFGLRSLYLNSRALVERVLTHLLTIELEDPLNGILAAAVNTVILQEPKNGSVSTIPYQLSQLRFEIGRAAGQFVVHLAK